HFHRNLYYGIVEKLHLIDPDHFHAKFDGRPQLGCIRYYDRIDAAVVAGDDTSGIEAIIHCRLEDLGSLPGYFGATEPSNQLLAFPAEHTAGYYFNPSPSGVHTIHWNRSPFPLRRNCRYHPERTLPPAPVRIYKSALLSSIQLALQPPEGPHCKFIVWI